MLCIAVGATIFFMPSRRIVCTVLTVVYNPYNTRDCILNLHCTSGSRSMNECPRTFSVGDTFGACESVTQYVWTSCFANYTSGIVTLSIGSCVFVFGLCWIALLEVNSPRTHVTPVEEVEELHERPQINTISVHVPFDGEVPIVMDAEKGAMVVINPDVVYTTRGLFE